MWFGVFMKKILKPDKMENEVLKLSLQSQGTKAYKNKKVKHTYVVQVYFK